MTWDADSVVDDFDKSYSIDDITAICQAVGFNTIPSWMKPYAVLSTGERFRVEMARQLLEGGDLIVVDEFTSVVDRQVAQIGAHAVQKYVRKSPGKQFVAATCHYDVIDWLQPDWMLEPPPCLSNGGRFGDDPKSLSRFRESISRLGDYSHRFTI